MAYDRSMGDFPGFLAIVVLVIVTPGPDTAVTVRSALLGGRSAGVSTAFGVVSGQLCWTLAASAGVTALLLASEPAFLAVRIAGGAYLGYLGVQALRAAFARHEPDRPAAAGAAHRLTAGRAYRQGLLSDLGSPKMAAFFTSLLPQFAPGDQPAFWAMLALGSIFCALTLVWLVAYAVTVAKAADVLNRPRLRRSIETITGTVLIALGLRLATEQR
jgi:threonine/homoserine/homoserine lactone efflux protein